ncbi:hypothetical protein BN961_01902 [Afipia felis]|uniref:Uncharacterized protein n=1 Tax=Afipia felis TaxID=1035 RepID=A0A090MM70_AFIFE|nr:hypothetical protein BN961_01902 [Afipia felis]
MLDAAAADRIVIAVEEGDREVRLLQPVLVGGLAEGGDGEREHQNAAGQANRRHLRQRFDEHPALPAADIEAVHERRIALIEFAQATARGEQRGIETRIEVQKEIPDPLHPLAGYDLAHQNFLNRRSRPWFARTLAAAMARTNMRVRLRHPHGDGEGNHRREGLFARSARRCLRRRGDHANGRQVPGPSPCPGIRLLLAEVRG